MRRACVLFGAAVLGAASARAEVSVDRLPDGRIVPFQADSPTGPWGIVRVGVPAVDVLNPAGDVVGDGRPVVLTNGASNRPEAAWASSRGLDVQFAEHDGKGWGAPRNLSRSLDVDRLPAVFSDTVGNDFVTWTSGVGDGVHVVRYTALAGDTRGQTGVVKLLGVRWAERQSSLGVASDGAAYVSYEEQATRDGFVSVAVDEVHQPRKPSGCVADGGLNTPDVARVETFQTAHATPAADARIQVHVEAGRLWIDWVNAPGELGSTRLVNGSFTPARYRTFVGDRGEERAREDARREALE